LAVFPWPGKEQLFEACELFDRAIARDPRYGPALAWAAVCNPAVETLGIDCRDVTPELLMTCCR
jgi:hypothetical protein